MNLCVCVYVHDFFFDVGEKVREIRRKRKKVFTRREGMI